MSGSAPTLLLTNGRIYPYCQPETAVESMAVRGGVIRGLGTEAEASQLASGPVKRLDLAGRVVMPGLWDAHIHLEHYALSLARVDCDTPTLQECLQRVAERAQAVPNGSWIQGHGWDQNRWGAYGSAADLDAVTPDHPVFLTAHSLHAAWANSAALRLAGIGPDTPDPAGGAIQRLADRMPSGILFENAMQLVSHQIPSLTAEELAAKLLTAQTALWKLGITGVHDFDGPSCFSALQLLLARGDLGLRVLKNIPVAHLEAATALGLRSGFGNRWIRLGNIKVFADGALGPRTAAMLEPYEGEPDNRGMLLVDQEELVEVGLRAAEAGFGMAVHAIGDLANHQVLNAFQAIRRHEAAAELPQLRHRIEHLQVLHPDDLPRTAELKIVASMQPTHALSDRHSADRYWGARSRYSYAWRSQLEAGALLAFGSDAPVEDPNPFLGLHAAVLRRDPDGQPGGEGWIPEERIGLPQALEAYTKGPAFAAGMESMLGELRPGYLADLIVLEEDPYRIEPDKIAGLRPVGTMVGGEWRIREF